MLKMLLVGIKVQVWRSGGLKVPDALKARLSLTLFCPDCAHAHAHPYFGGVDSSDEVEERRVRAVDEDVGAGIWGRQELALERDIHHAKGSDRAGLGGLEFLF